jgi:hypothetical protein
MVLILDPTDERVPIARQLTPRPEHITGTVALLDISKPRGNVLLDRLEELLAERLPRVRVKRYRKPTFAKPAPEHCVSRSGSDFVIEAPQTEVLARRAHTVWFEINGKPPSWHRQFVDAAERNRSLGLPSVALRPASDSGPYG